MKRLLPSALLLLLVGLLTGVAQPDFQFNRRLTNEIWNARARLNAQPSKLTPTELNRLAETLARSNLLATVIGEAIARNDLTNAAALLKDFPGKLDDIRLYGQPLLCRAVNEGKEQVLDFLLANKADPDAVAPYGEPALTQAMQSRRWSMAAKLIQAGASVTRTNNQGRSPAAMFFDQWYPGPMAGDGGSLTNLLSLMLEHGLDPFAASRPGQPSSILEECLSRESGYYSNPYLNGRGFGGASSASPLLTFGDLLLTNKPSPARRTPLGDTALHLAAHWQHTNAIEFLLAAGFSIDQTNNAGLTPLQLIVGAGANGMNGYGFGFFGQGLGYFVPSSGVMRSGVSGQPPPPKTMVDHLLDKGATLDVFSAAGLGRTNELAALLATHATLVNVSDAYGRTPLHYATLNAPPNNAGPVVRVGPQGRPMVVSGTTPNNAPPDVVLMLLKADANPSAATTQAVPQFRNSTAIPAGTTPLHLAARIGNATLIRTLLGAHADAKLADANGDLPLHLAARTWATNALPLFLKARASLEATNRAGQTPLRAAVESGCAPSAEVLLNAGASSTNGLSGTTLLHLAAERGDMAMLAVLLKHKLPLEARDREGRTPFQIAAAAKSWNAILFFRDQGANLSATNFAGDSVLHLLASQQDDNVSHLPEEPAMLRWERRQLTTPGWTSRALSWLIQAKVLNPPPVQGWTNTSLTAWLIERGAPVNATNRAGRTPLHVLCEAQWMNWHDFNQSSNRLVEMLNAGARLDLADSNGVSPLQIAATNTPPSMLAFLVRKAGKGINFADARGRTLLHHAAERPGDGLERIHALLSAGADPNIADKQGSTPLHLAMQLRNDGYDYRRGDLLRTLLTNKANPNLADKEGRTPLHVLLGATNTYYRPIDQWGDVFSDPRWDFAMRDHDGETPLHLWAARMQNSGNDLESFERILTNRSLVNITNYAGDTLLHVAIRANHDQVARALMQIGANPALKNLHGETPLHLAVEKSPAFFDQEVHPPGTRYRFFDSIRLRDEQDVNLWLAADPGLASLTNASGITPLMAAADAGNTNIIARLLERGAPMDALSALRLGLMEDFRKLLPGVRRPVPGDWFFEAVRFGRLEALQALIAVGGDVQFADADGNSLLSAAGFYKRPEILSWLKTLGCHETLSDAVIEGDREKVSAFITADASCVNLTNRNGRTPLYRAAAAGQAEVVALLLERGAKVDAAMPGGWTALHAAAARDAVEIGSLLLKAGAPPNAVAQGNLAPLHLAAALGCTNMAGLLLQNGADVNLIPPQQGGYARNSPLHWAAHLGQLNMFKLLLARGADLSAINQQNQTPLDFARATARGQHWGFSQPPETSYKRDQTMFQPAKRDATIKQLEAAAAAYAKP